MTDTDKKRTFIYRIDKNDRIIYVDDEWLSFAQENQGELLNRENIYSKSLWDLISGNDTVFLYQHIFDRVRSTKQEIEIPFRCDSPTCRRYMNLIISAQINGVLEFLSQIVREEPRDYVSVFDANIERSEEFMKVCSWCKKVALSEGDWREIEEAVNILELYSKLPSPQITHGMCPECRVLFFKDLKIN